MMARDEPADCQQVGIPDRSNLSLHTARPRPLYGCGRVCRAASDCSPRIALSGRPL